MIRNDDGMSETPRQEPRASSGYKRAATLRAAIIGSGTASSQEESMRTASKRWASAMNSMESAMISPPFSPAKESMPPGSIRVGPP